jgi:site-specific recombinase XerD
MIELAQLKLARASRDWFSDTELASSAATFVRSLSEQGYAPETIRIYLECVAHFAHWCARQRIGLLAINEDVAGSFLNRHLHECRCSQRCQRARHSVRAALTRFLSLLRAEDRIAPKQSPDPAGICEEIRRFEHYLTQVCGLSPATCTARIKLVRAFLLDQFSAGRVCTRVLRAPEVVRFLRKYTQGWKASSQRDVGNSLRSYFRFKALHGERTTTLIAAIPTVAQWRLARLPKGISADQLTRLLRAFDRGTATGKRDYAITRCFVDLGLRTIEVARLRLEDFDWRQGLVRIRGKGRRVDVLPLPQATGRALVDYLRHGRPMTSSRAMFLRHRPPLNIPATPCVVRAAVRYAAARSGVQSCLHGPQVLRHTLAQRLVQGGTPLKQIADLLRHRSLDTTTIYAKVDLPALRRVALPWPGRQS